MITAGIKIPLTTIFRPQMWQKQTSLTRIEMTGTEKYLNTTLPNTQFWDNVLYINVFFCLTVPVKI